MTESASCEVPAEVALLQADPIAHTARPGRRPDIRRRKGMTKSPRWTTAAGLLAVLVSASCSTASGEPVARGVHPETHGEAHSEAHATSHAGAHAGSHAAAPAERGSRPRHTEADVRFMQGMISHHAQALDMTVLVPDRSQRNDVRLLSQRIEVSQADEIALMQRWLRSRGAEAPDPRAHHGHAAHGGDAGHGGHGAHMPGMLTPDELARLAAATGEEFDRLFLEFMIRHHEGAITMVAELFATPGAGQDAEIFQFASEVDVDQRMEIERMRRMQNGPLSGARQR